MKEIKRTYEIGNERFEDGLFIATGIWADGHLAYSRLDENHNIIEEDEGMFAQVRENGKLLMVRI